MSKLCRILLCVWWLTVLGVTNSVVIFSQSDSQSSGMPAIKEASGEIISVDAAAKTVVAKIKQEETGSTTKDVTLLIDADTMITSQDSSLAVSDLQAGNKVTVVYETVADGTNIANSIMVW
jgi:hypothetical protein